MTRPPVLHTAILGAGVTGLAAGVALGCPVFEATAGPGGICGSYYLAAAGTRHARPPDDEVYRFEVGGGHWIFGGDDATLAWIESLAPCRTYERRASVDLGEGRSRVAFPIQNHLSQLGPDVAARCWAEISAGVARSDRGLAEGDRTPGGSDAAGSAADGVTMQSWMRGHFGPTLAELFFEPFHERYTAGLHRSVAPQDAGKSPIDIEAIAAGAIAADVINGTPIAAGYNQRFAYPTGGLDALVHAMAGRADVRYAHRVVAIDTARRRLRFADGTDVAYERLLSTLPLHVAVALAGIDVAAPPDPYTSVLVVNVGAEPGPQLGDDHWVYVPRSRSAFHRYGVYSNVDEHFLPASTRSRGAAPATRASLYVERAYRGGDRPSNPRQAADAQDMVGELQERGVIGAVDVIDPTWIDVAYTWSWPGSTWRPDAIATLASAGVEQIGRYGRWHFQGIAASIHEGLTVKGA